MCFGGLKNRRKFSFWFRGAGGGAFVYPHYICSPVPTADWTCCWREDYFVFGSSKQFPALEQDSVQLLSPDTIPRPLSSLILMKEHHSLWRSTTLCEGASLFEGLRKTQMAKSYLFLPEYTFLSSERPQLRDLNGTTVDDRHLDLWEARHHPNST